MDLTQFLQWATLGTNVTVIMTAYKLIRHVSKIELKIDILWGQFCKEMKIDGVGD